MEPPSITERLANMSIPSVLITIAVLLVIRYVLLKQKTPITKSIAEIAESLAVAMALVFLLIRPFIIQAFFIPSESMVPTLLKHDHIMVNKFGYRFWEPGRGDVIVFKAPKEADAANPQDPQERDFIKRVIAVPGDEVRITPGYVMIANVEYTHRDLRNLLQAGDLEGSVKLVNQDRVLVNGKPVSLEEIAAAAGEPDAEVVVVTGRVYVNGKPIKEDYVAEDPDDRYPNERTPRKWLAIGKRGESKGRLVVKIPKGRLLVLGDNRNNSRDARYWGLLDRRRVLGKAMFIFWPLGRISWVH